MDADKMSHVCRTCLEEIYEINPLKLNDDTNNIKLQLLQCIPELDLDLIPNACMCVFCARQLQDAYDFKLKCLQSEETIRNHLQNTIVPDLDVIKKCFQPDRDILNIGNLETVMEVVYTRDDHLRESEEPVQSFLDDDTIAEPKINGFAKPTPPVKTPTKPVSRLKSEELKLQSQVTYTTKKVDRTFDCIKCDFKTSRSFLLKQHMNTHKTTNSTKPKSQSIKQVVTHNGVKGYFCDSCPYTAKTKLILRKHKLSHKKKKNHSTADLWSHINEHERSSHLSDEKNLKLTIKVYKKNGLEQNAMKKNGLEQSTSKKNGLEQQNTTNKNGLEQNAEGYQRTKCNYKVSGMKKLQEHQIEHNGKYKCKKCNFETNRSLTLKKHMTSHVNNKKQTHNNWAAAACAHCPYKAKHLLSLQYHRSLHTGNREFKCHLCTFNVKTKHILDKHILVHKS